MCCVRVARDTPWVQGRTRKAPFLAVSDGGTLASVGALPQGESQLFEKSGIAEVLARGVHGHRNR